MTNEDASLLRTTSFPFRIYQPTRGGGVKWASLIKAKLVEVQDVGDDQEAILELSLTDAGRAALPPSTP